MNSFIEGFASFWREYGPWVAASLIPTILTGLTMSPKTAEAAPVVQKIWNGLRMLLDFLSVLTHKDKPGTFQLPLRAGAVVNKVLVKNTTVVVLLIAASLSQTNCAWWASTKGDVKQAAINCALESAKESARPLVLTMVGILTGASEDTWKRQASLITKEFGKDAVACATRYALERVTNPVQSEEDPELIKATVTARVRALELDQGWKFVE